MQSIKMRIKKLLVRWLLPCMHIFISMSFGLPCLAETFSARVIGVIDGDTIVVEHQGEKENIRLNGIDCPRAEQRFSSDATTFTHNACFDKNVQVETFNRDANEGTTADVRLPDGTLLNEELVRTGFAWCYQKYAPNPNNKKLQQLESTAREKHIGLWSEVDPMPPWKYQLPTQEAKKPLEGRLLEVSSGISKPLLQADAKASDELLRSQLSGTRSPLQAQIRQVAPLEGGVEKLDSNLQQDHPAYDGYATHPLLQAKANGSASIMRIVQSKFSPLTPEAAAAPVRPLPPERDGVPLRAATTENSPPVRDSGNQYPPARTSSTLPPSSNAFTEAPRRPEGRSEQPPGRDYAFGDGPPIRTAVGGTPPPPRAIAMAPPPPTNAEPRQKYNNSPPTSTETAGQPSSQRKEKPRKKVSDPTDKQERTKNTQVQLGNPPQQLPSAAEEALLWDAWYKRVNELVCVELTRTLLANGNPAGHNLIKVTVWANNEIQSAIVQPSNRNFDKAILEAYQALNHSPGLTFPKGTQRKVVDYETAHIQDVSAPTAGFDSRTIRNDVEIIK